MRITAKRVVGGAVVAAVALFALATLDYDVRSHEQAQVFAALNDIATGKTLGGTLHADSPQLLCVDPSDLATAAAPDAGIPGRRSTIVGQLAAEGRCTYSDQRSGFMMDAEGRQVYATQRGTVIALWAAR